MTDEEAIGRLLRAIGFAAEKHRVHRRKDVEASAYINHPIALARLLWQEAGIRDVAVVEAALLHDTVEDTDTTFEEIEREFGREVARLVREVTDDKSLDKTTRKRLQVERAPHASSRAKQIKLADKICNLRDLVSTPPVGWSLERRQRYFDWAKQVVDGLRGDNPRLEHLFDEIYCRRPES